MKLSKLLITSIALVVISVSTMGQDCVSYFPVKVGAERELTQYNAKNKVTGVTKQKVTSVENIANGIKISFRSELYNEKGDSVYKGNYVVKCEKGVFYIDMKSFLSGETMSAYKDMDVQVTSENLGMPSTLAAGQTLDGGSVTMVIKNQGFQIMSMKTTIKNRKVEAIENVTTPAGTFECYKISYDVESKMMFTVETKCVEWYAKNVGLVKNEVYDKKGKLSSSSVLTKTSN